MGTGCCRHDTEWPKRSTARRMDAAAAQRGRRARAEDRFEQHLLRGRPALPEALSQHRCRSGGPCRATQIVKHRKHRLATRLLRADWPPSLAQAKKEWTKVPSHCEQTAYRVPDPPKQQTETTRGLGNGRESGVDEPRTCVMATMLRSDSNIVKTRSNANAAAFLHTPETDR